MGPENAGAASPSGSGELKFPRFPPVAKGPSTSGFWWTSCRNQRPRSFPLIGIVQERHRAFHERLVFLRGKTGIEVVTPKHAWASYNQELPDVES